jgi:hypothetical protein
MVFDIVVSTLQMAQPSVELESTFFFLLVLVDWLPLRVWRMFPRK